MGWTQINQGADEELLSLGCDLSAILFCPVRYCESHYNKPIFECHCEKIFPRFAVKSAQESGDWSMIIKRHREKD